MEFLDFWKKIINTNSNRDLFPLYFCRRIRFRSRIGSRIGLSGLKKAFFWGRNAPNFGQNIKNTPFYLTASSFRAHLTPETVSTAKITIATSPSSNFHYWKFASNPRFVWRTSFLHGEIFFSGQPNVAKSKIEFLVDFLDFWKKIIYTNSSRDLFLL